MIASTHRAHGHTLAKGTHPNELAVELTARVEGATTVTAAPCTSTTSSAEISVRTRSWVEGFLRSQAPPSRSKCAASRVAVAFFSDKATNIGTFHESSNLAQLWRVPALFVCENNHYAESTPASQLPIEDLEQRAVAFGMTSMKVDGQDVEAVYKATKKALEHARGQGPGVPPRETFRLTATTSAIRRCTGRRRRCGRFAPKARSAPQAPREVGDLRRRLGRARSPDHGLVEAPSVPPWDGSKAGRRSSRTSTPDARDHVPRGDPRLDERGDAPRRRRLHHG